MSVEFIPDVVRWTHVGVTYVLELEMDDTPISQDEDEIQDMDTTEGGGAPGDQDKGSDKSPRESAKGPNAQPDKADNSAKEAPPSTTPMNTLHFGSFGPRSAPSRLWSTRVEADDPAELELPPVVNLACEAMTTLERHVDCSPDMIHSTPGGQVDTAGLAVSEGGRGQETHSTRLPASVLISLGGAPGQEVYGVLPTSTSPVELGVRCGKESRAITPP